MENALLYLIIATGVGLIIAGAYGAAPVLFPRRGMHAGGGHHAVRPIFTLGAAFPLLEEDLSRSRPAIEEVVATAPPREEPAVSDEILMDVDSEGPPPAVFSTPDFDEALLNDLMIEIEMLRGQIEGLRSELGLLSLKTAIAPRTAPAESEPRRRTRSQSADLPQPLRRQLVELRRHKKSA